MSPETMVDERERVNDSARNTKDDQVFENLRKSMPHNMEKEWRLMDIRRYALGPEYADKKLLAKKRFDPFYAPCPWPVKIVPTGGWTPGNVKRCNHRIPAGLAWDERQGLATLHCEDHLDYYFEYHAPRAKDGTPMLHRPPATTKISPPLWTEGEGDDPTAPQRERVEMRLRMKLLEGKMKESEAVEEVVKEVNEFNETRGRGRPRKESTDE